MKSRMLTREEYLLYMVEILVAERNNTLHPLFVDELDDEREKYVFDEQGRIKKIK